MIRNIIKRINKLLKKIIKKIAFTKLQDTDKLISDSEKLILDATQFKRFESHHFEYRGFTLNVTDFISVAYQLKEFFEDGRMFFKTFSETPVIYDCGANVGVAVLYYKNLYPNAVVKAFEPDPIIFNCLKKNLNQNGIFDVVLFDKAVWKNNDGISFGSQGADGGSIFFEGNKILLPSIRLKDLLSEETHIDLLKIDIEGAELEVLLDCKNELYKIDFLFIEYHSWKKEYQHLDLILKALSDNGFRYFIHSVGEHIQQPFMEHSISGDMDIQLDIHAINLKNIL